MKILAVSDSHGTLRYLEEAVEREQPNLIVHLGDRERDAQRLSEHYPQVPMLSVPGNCDHPFPGRQLTLLRELENVRVMITHGHPYGVKSGLLTIELAAREAGAGVELAHRLQERDYGPLVHVEEGGTQGMTLLPLLEDADTLILLDAVRTGALPGTVVTRSREELPRHFSRVMSPHQIGMKEVLGAAQLCGTLPRAITLVGVEALHTDFCRPMSAEVQEALPKALDTAEALIARALAEHQAQKNAHA